MRLKKIHATCYPLLAIFILVPAFAARAGDFNALKGYWQCQEEGVGSSLEFVSADRLIYNGQSTSYQLMHNMLLVQEEYGTEGYYYQVERDKLVIVSADGGISQCRRGKKSKPAGPAGRQADKGGTAGGAGKPGTLMPGRNWPVYRRPGRTVAWSSGDPQALLYKFAGRWDRVSTNTLTNLYLKPDGSYEEAYEAGYSGTFTDQGGYQTGAWGAAGSQQAGGQWMISGTLEKGVLTLVSGDGSQTRLNYRVHVKNGEYYGGEYFFNGELYSVEYIYR